jgi:hypothetical protein
MHGSETAGPAKKRFVQARMHVSKAHKGCAKMGAIGLCLIQNVRGGISSFGQAQGADGGGALGTSHSATQTMQSAIMVTLLDLHKRMHTIGY